MPALSPERSLTFVETCERKENNERVPACFREVASFLPFQRSGDGRVHKLLGKSIIVNICLSEDVLIAYGRDDGRGSSILRQDDLQVTSASRAYLTVENYPKSVKDYSFLDSNSKEVNNDL